jgi:uncharacterized membrane protein
MELTGLLRQTPPILHYLEAKMDKTLRGAAEMTAAMTILGTIGLFVVLSGQGAIDVVFWRCAFGALALLVICATQGLFRRQLTWKKLGLAALGGVAIVVNWAMLFSAYGEASIGVATAVYNTQPFILVGFGALFLGERITANKLGWLGIAFLGVLLIVQAKPGSVDYAGSNYALGIGLALAAAFFPDPGRRRHPDARPFRQLDCIARGRDSLGLTGNARHRPYRDHVHTDVWRGAETADLPAGDVLVHLSGRCDLR